MRSVEIIQCAIPTGEGSEGAACPALVQEEDRRGQLDQQVTIGSLFDDVLLEIFRFYLLNESASWFTLAHVCQRWRCVVSGTPRHLNLHLMCAGYKPPGEMLDAWPEMPIHIVHIDESQREDLSESEVNYVTDALKHNDRVSKVKIKIQSGGYLQLSHLLTEMQEPFPMLEYLDIQSKDPSEDAVIPDSFLGGSAPLLVHLGLVGIPFPGLPRLLLSADHLVDVHLRDIPQAHHISPEVMAASLSAMIHLQSLHIGIRSRQASQHSIPATCIVLPALKHLKLKCPGNYLEDLVARIDAPELESMGIFYPRPSDVFDFSELPQFISRIKAFEMSDQAQLRVNDRQFELITSQKMRTVDRAELSLIFAAPCHATLLSAFFSSLPPLHFKFENLEIHDEQFMISALEMQVELREISRRFHAVKNLFLDTDASIHVGRVLKAFVEGNPFPALQNIFVQEQDSLRSTSARLLASSTREAFLQFSAERQLAGLPVTLHVWERGERGKVRRLRRNVFL